MIPTSVEQGAFRALADPTRRDILRILAEREMTIGEVSGQFDMTRAAVKKHLTVLFEGELITVEARGREKINRLRPEGLKRASAWFEYFDRFWDEKLSALKDAVESEGEKRDD